MKKETFSNCLRFGNLEYNYNQRFHYWFPKKKTKRNRKENSLSSLFVMLEESRTVRPSDSQPLTEFHVNLRIIFFIIIEKHKRDRNNP